MRLGFVTCDALAKYFPSKENPLITHDDEVAAKHFAAHGIEVVPVLWGAPHASLRAQNLSALIVRSPWNYADSHEQCARFIDWLIKTAQSGVKLINDAELMRWNLDKRYLAHLAEAGVAIMPTTFIEPHDTVDWHDIFRTRGPFVIKPAIGAGAKDLKRFITSDDIKNNHLDALRQHRTFLLQPYAKDVEELGEWSLVYFDGCYSHAVLKKPGTKQWLVQDELGGSVETLPPPKSVRLVADVALEQVAKAYFLGTGRTTERPTYARVDIMRCEGNDVVSELELVEPELFFLSRYPTTHVPNREAMERFRVAVMKALAQSI